MPEIDFASRHLLVIAFEGWNDAGDAASTSVRLLQESLEVTAQLELAGEEYFDYQLTRPTITRPDSGPGVLHWPTVVWHGQKEALRRRSRERLEAPKVSFLSGTEPALAWRAFSAEVVETAVGFGVSGVVFVGAMLADVPHSRPISVTRTSENEALRKELGLSRPSYEGPVGVLAALAAEFDAVGIPSMSIWASVPHYVHAAPSPKAALALVEALEALLDIPIPRGALEEEARDWEASIDSMASEDEDMAGYIAGLERARDTVDAPEASGDAIAQEFERYLRGDDDEPRSPQQGGL